jgi:hypothetical protein
MMHPLLSYSEPDQDDGDLDDDGQSDSQTNFNHHHGMDSNKAEIRKVSKNRSFQFLYILHFLRLNLNTESRVQEIKVM